MYKMFILTHMDPSQRKDGFREKSWSASDSAGDREERISNQRYGFAIVRVGHTLSIVCLDLCALGHSGYRSKI